MHTSVSLRSAEMTFLCVTAKALLLSPSFSEVVFDICLRVEKREKVVSPVRNCLCSHIPFSGAELMGTVTIISSSLLVQGDLNHGCSFKISSEIFCGFPTHTLSSLKSHEPQFEL